MTPRRRGSDEAGIASVVLILLTVAFLALTALVWDGGRAITARQQAADLAEQAARAGADDLDVDAARSSGLDRIDITAAVADACRYLRTVAPAASCAATATPTSVSVTVTTHTRTALLALVGYAQMASSGRATATAVRGVTSAEGSRP